MNNRNYPKTSFDLPDDYKEYAVIDLLKNRKELKAVCIFSVVIVAVTAVLGIVIWNIFGADVKFSWVGLATKFLILLVGIFLYIVLHEAVHGIFIRKYSGKKAYYGYGFGYAYAGSNAYFNKKDYITIALAPVIVWGVVLLLLNFILPINWFWVVYGIQIMNLSGAAGDFYVVYKILSLPAEIMVLDSATKMTVYKKQNSQTAEICSEQHEKQCNNE